MPITKLVSVQITLDTDAKTVIVYPSGYMYTLLVDPETGIYYEPKMGWEVTGDNLEEHFQPIQGGDERTSES